MESPRSRPARRTLVDSYIDNHVKPDAHPAFLAVREERGLRLASSAMQAPNRGQLRSNENEPSAQTRETRIALVESTTEDISESVDDSTLVTIYQDAEKETQMFQRALKSFEKNMESQSSKSKYKAVISGKATSWADVLEEVDIVADRYNNPVGKWGRIRKGYRKFGEKAPALNAWLEFIPKQSGYTSTLFGGLKLIIGGASRLKDLREEITDALEELPSLLECTKKAVGIWNRSKELHECSAGLYVSVLTALHHIIRYMEQKSGVRGLKALIGQDSFGEEMKRKMADIQRASDQFKTVAELCSYDAIQKTHRVVVAQRQEARQDKTDVVNILAENLSEIASLKGAMAGEALALRQQLQETVDNLVANFLSGNNRIDYSTRDERGPILPVRKSNPKDRDMAYRDIFTLLDVDKDSAIRDAAQVSKTIWSLPRASQDRAVAIMQNHKLHAWLKSLTSTTIFINGNHSSTTSKLLPTSFVSAKLFGSIWEMSNSVHSESRVIPLVFFFGEHSRATDPQYGAEGAVRSLIAQLLAAYRDFSLPTLRKVKNLYKSELDELEMLLQVLMMLLNQIPPSLVVFCILDGLTHYENVTRMRDDAEFIVRGMTGVVDYTRQRERCVFKLMFMSSWNSQWMYKAVTEEDDNAEVVWVPSKVPSVGGFSAMKWDASMEKGLNS